MCFVCLKASSNLTQSNSNCCTYEHYIYYAYIYIHTPIVSHSTPSSQFPVWFDWLKMYSFTYILFCKLLLYGITKKENEAKAKPSSWHPYSLHFTLTILTCFLLHFLCSNVNVRPLIRSVDYMYLQAHSSTVRSTVYTVISIATDRKYAIKNARLHCF